MKYILDFRRGYCYRWVEANEVNKNELDYEVLHMYGQKYTLADIKAPEKILDGTVKALIDVYNGVCFYVSAAAEPIIECKADYKFNIIDSKYYYTCECACKSAPIYIEEVAAQTAYIAFGNEL